MLPAEVFQSSITNEGDNINSVNSHVVYIFWKGPKQATSRGCNICDVCAGRTIK
jgi:hypothetical protein